MTSKISESLGIPEEIETEVSNTILTVVDVEPTELVPVEDNQLNEKDKTEDYRLSRKVFRNLISQGNTAITELFTISKQSENPRAYEVLATLMRTVADTTKDLYDLHKKNKELNGEERVGQPGVSVDKAVFVGTTAELLAQIKKKNVSE